MVYVVTLFRIMPRNSCVEVYENFRDALLRASIWAGMDEEEALAANINDLNQWVMQNPTCTIQTAEFFPQLPLEPMETLYDSK